MDIITKLCEELTKNYPGLYIDTIMEGPQQWQIVFSNIYGTTLDMEPLEIDKPEQLQRESASFYLTRIAIPEAYQSYKEQAIHALEQNDEVAPLLQTSLDARRAINILFTRETFTLDVPQLYALGHYLLQMIDMFCTEEERTSARQLKTNAIIESFLESTLQEKLAACTPFYWVPSALAAYFKQAERILKFACSPTFEQDTYAACKAALLEQEESLLTLFEQEDCILFAKDYWMQQVEQLQQDLAIEFAYCEQTSDEKSIRMLEFLTNKTSFADDSELFQQPPTFTPHFFTKQEDD